MRLSALVLGLLFLAACGDNNESRESLAFPLEEDAGTPDAGTPDAGTPDAGTPDAGTPKPDAGTPDGGTPKPDAGTPDAGTPKPDPGTPVGPAWPELQTTIQTYALTIKPEHLKALEDNIHDREYVVPAEFSFEGRTWKVEVRYRGRSTRYEVKKPWQVRFEKEDRFQGAKRLELLAAYKDGGYLTEKLWYDLAASVGLDVPRARYVHLTVNGRYEGVYTELESIDKAFLKAHALDSDGDIYRCGMHDCEVRPPPAESYMERWDKRTNEEQPWDRLWAFIDGVNRTPPHQFRAFAEQHMVLDDYLTWMALDTFISNDYQVDSRSYFIYDRERGKWFYVPWDLNNAVSLYNRTNSNIPQGVTWRAARPPLGFTAYDPWVYDLAELRKGLGHPDMKPTWSTLSTRIADDEVLRARYVARLRTLLEDWLTEENLGKRIEATHRLLAPFILAGPDGKAKDPHVSSAHAAYSPEFLRRFVRERRAWLLSQLSAIEAHGQGALVIDRVGRDASGAFWVQLYNRGDTPVSLNGLYLSGFTRVPTESRLPATTLPPRGHVTLRQGAAEEASRLQAKLNAQRPEVALYAADGRTALDMLWLAPLAPGEAYGRQPRGAETFGPQPGP
jgi:spore coat protein H